MPVKEGQPRIGFIGAGILGSGLALALHQAGYAVCAVSSRTLWSAEVLAARLPGCEALTDAQEVADAADLVFITTSDVAIGPVAESVRWRPGQWVVHCCGALGQTVLQPAAEQGASAGAFHPFQTFAGLDGPEATAARLSGVTFAVSAEGCLEAFLQRLAGDLGGRAVVIDEELRSLYHAAAVLSCGYLVTLLQAAVEVWQAAGFSEEEGMAATLAVSRATLDNVARLGPKAGVTGPLVRGDVATVQGHLAALMPASPEIARLYAALTEKSLPLALELGLTPQGAAAIKQTLAEPELGSIDSTGQFAGRRW